MSIQLGWFKKLKSSLCTTKQGDIYLKPVITLILFFFFNINFLWYIQPFISVIDCDNYFKKSLFLVGEIGGNDYNYAFFVGASIKKLRAFVPVVVDAITKATSVSSLINDQTLHVGLDRWPKSSLKYYKYDTYKKF